MVRRLFVLSAVVIGLGGCVGPAPIRDYNLANTALESAKRAKAPEVAPGYWARARQYYREAQKYYKNQEYEKARALFKKARLFAERAENFTVLKNMREGGDI